MILVPEQVTAAIIRVAVFRTRGADRFEYIENDNIFVYLERRQLPHHLVYEGGNRSSFQPAIFSFVQITLTDVGISKNGWRTGNNQAHSFFSEFLGELSNTV